MAFEFDHLFICTDIGAYEADRLVSLGLVEGRSNTHPGQGTANRCFFFRNAMLELLWVYDAEEAKSEPIRPTRLWERWANRNGGACPFGVCLRSTTNGGEIVAFSSWAYRPPYLPEPLNIAVGTNSNVLTEPMLFQTPFGKRPDSYSTEKAQPLDHHLGLREITRVELVTPTADRPSPELQAAIRQSRRYANDIDRIGLRVGGGYCVELGFDGEVQGHQVDFSPGLPLIISW
jgi:Glyoxalase-like domain